ncbi:MAG: phytanoyl-CoA dioxygenase family protein, partial [Acidimicrobiales bacterium]|nr:phytanoyl-CoA dioxygenase family protein [Acidimicrobiales bacterium]
MTVDLRTRSDAAPPAVHAATLLARDLPAAFDRLGPRAATVATRTLRPLEVEVDGESWTWRPDGDRVSVVPGRPTGDGRRAHVRLRAEQLEQLAADLVTPVGLWTASSLDIVEGSISHVMDWWLVLRAALDDHRWEPVDEIDLPADLHRSFAPDEDPADMRRFLEQAGYLHLRGLFTADEMTQISADMDAAAPTYSRGDGNSWWAETTDGPQLVRMQGFQEHSPTTAALLADRRFLQIADVPGCGHVRRRTEGNAIEALFKPLGVTEGISDIPWHKDCSLGRHSYECCSLTVGISVTGGGPTTGQLRVIAGSHRVLMWPALADPTTVGLPEVELPTEVGDVTVHLSCTHHMAQPPTERPRRVMYT